jgi:hypothetical protein
MKGRILHTVLAALTLLCACNPNTTSLDTFVKDENVRLELDGVKVFVHDDATCQLSFNRQRGSFRSHTDTMLDYFVVELDAIPESEGASAVANIYWSSTDGERSRKNITLEAKRIKGDLIWLCDAGRRTAAVVRVLE